MITLALVAVYLIMVPVVGRYAIKRERLRKAKTWHPKADNMFACVMVAILWPLLIFVIGYYLLVYVITGVRP